MPVKIRLMRIGAKKRPFYRVVAVDERRKRTGKYIENLGTYNPLTEPKEIILNKERITWWMEHGAVASDGYLRIIKQAPQKPPRKPKKEKKQPAEAAKEPVKESTEEQQEEIKDEEVKIEEVEVTETPAAENSETPVTPEVEPEAEKSQTPTEEEEKAQ